jgi:hypothetical protein
MCHFSGRHSPGFSSSAQDFHYVSTGRYVPTYDHPFAPRTIDPRQEDAQNRHDHAQSDLFRLQSCSLPFQENGKGQPPDGGYLGIEFATQIGDHAVGGGAGPASGRRTSR